MECEVFRRKIYEDCARPTPEMDEHERGCPACAAIAARARSAEQLIQKAVRFDIAAVKDAASAAPAPSPVVERRSVAWAGMAATFVGAIAIWFAIQAGGPVTTEDLVVEVLQHWNHEPGSWDITDVSVSNVVLERALDGKATVDLAGIGPVTYARSCRVAGQWMPHLVVQTSEGPVMVLLVPDRVVDESVPLSLPDQGIEGMLRPHGNGSIVVIGDGGQALEPIEDEITDAVEWTI